MYLPVILCITTYWYLVILNGGVRGLSNKRTINWSRASQLERQYWYPAYVEVASSACDLTENHCDLSCCSDVDCSESQKQSFKCLGGLSDGEKTDILPSWDCKHQSLENNDFWLPILCFVFTNTPYLGEYFTTKKKIESLSKLDKAVHSKEFNYKHKTSLNETDSSYYKYGSPIKTFTFVENNVFEFGILRLPQNIINRGLCSDLTPVRFLENTDSNCLRRITKENCNGFNPPLGALKYMVFDTFDSTFSYVSFPRVAEDNTGQNLSIAEVKYLCLTNGSDYLTFTNSALKRVSNYWNATEEPFSDHVCYQDTENLHSPSYNETTESCNNVVVSVTYSFAWNNSKLTNLVASFSLADIPLTQKALLATKLYAIDTHKSIRGSVIDTDFYVAQRFSVIFEHSESYYVAKSAGQIWQRSGNPGYEIGRPLLSWRWNASNETNSTLEIATVGVWSSGHRGCRDVTPVTFGSDVITRCTLELRSADEEDCHSLRSRVQTLQDSLMSGHFLAGGGAEWNATAGAATLVPILSAPVTLGAENSSDASDACKPLPTAHVLHVMYTTVTHATGRRIHRVVGAKRSVETEPCPEVTMPRRHLVLSSAVVFVRVPVDDAAPRSRFWQHVLAPHGSSTAWVNLFRVFDHVVTSDEMIEISVACIVASMLAVVMGSLFARQLM